MPATLTKSRSKKQLEKRLISLGKIVSVIAHELKSPLSGIVSLSKITMDKNNIDPKTKEYLGLIYKGAVECENTIKNILQYTKPIQPQTLSNTNINELINTWLEYIKKVHTIKHPLNTAIETRFEQELPEIQIEESMIKEVFTNIILNAFEALKNANAPKLIIGTTKDKNNIYISFMDNGCGIPKENIDNIFTPFFSTKEKGIGLGMTISRNIIEKHGGYIKIDSEVNKGTNITIKLPVKK